MSLVELIWFRRVEGGFSHIDGIRIDGVILVDSTPSTGFVHERTPVVFVAWSVTPVDDNPGIMLEIMRG